MEKRQLIEEIRKLNSTATPEFLEQFDAGDLEQYLEHLEGAKEHRMRISSWVRKPGSMRMVS